MQATAQTVNLQCGTQLVCHGDGSGEASVSVIGGCQPYSYSWSNGATTDTLTGLSAGTYGVKVTDSLGGQITGSVVLNEPAPLSWTLTGTQGLCTYRCRGPPFRLGASFGAGFYGGSGLSGITAPR